MVSFGNLGTPIPNHITFNAGTINFGGLQMVQLDTITLSYDSTTLGQYVIGSIQPQALVRHTLKYSLTAKYKSFEPQIDALAFGASSTGTNPIEIFPLDGQPSFQNPIINLYDINNNQYQYQMINAIWKSNKLTAKMADYTEWDIEIDAMTMIIISMPS